MTWTRCSGADQSAAMSAAQAAASRAESEASTATTTGRGSVLLCMVFSGLVDPAVPSFVAPPSRPQRPRTPTRGVERPSASATRTSQLGGEHRGFGAPRDAEFVQQGGDVVLHRLLRQ